MFGLVDVQESFPNINGIELFNKVFKKSHSAFAETRGGSVHNVWVLPGHIIVSLDDGHKLLAFDLLPKPKPWPDVTDFLSPKQASKKKGQALSAFEVFSIGSSPLYMFIVMKNAEVHVWKFVRPAFEWIFVSKLALSPGKNIQIMSLNFDSKSGTLYWCERRTPTQCCVCRRTVLIDNEKDMLSKTSDILHNCPPVQLFIVGPAGVLLQPMANSPTGLTMYWSAASSQLQLHMWNYLNNGIIPLSASSDFQSLVTDSISLWINQNQSDPAAVAYCTHPVSQELLILESTSDLFSIKMDVDGRPVIKKLCSLSRVKLGDLNQRKKYKMFAFKKFVALLLEDGEMLVFETYKGMLIWSDESLKHERPRVWVSQGNIPRVGVWSPSFIRVLRSESVVKQAEGMLKLETSEEHGSSSAQKERKISKEYTLHLTFKGDHGKKGKETYVVVDQENEPQHDHSNRDGGHDEQIPEDLGDHATSESLMLVSEYLRDWNTKNLSSEVCLWLLNHPKLNLDGKWLQFRNKEEFNQIFKMFDNPCIPLALLHKNPKYKHAVFDIMKDYVSKQGNSVTASADPGLLDMMKRYCSLSEDINTILENDSRGNKSKSDDDDTRVSFKSNLETQLQDDNLTKEEFYEVILWGTEMMPVELISVVARVLGLGKEGAKRDAGYEVVESKVGTEKLQSTFWRNILRKDIKTFEVICNGLWEHSPQLLLEYVQKAQNAAAVSESGGFLRATRRSSLLSMDDVVKRALKVLPYRNCTQQLTEDQVKILVELILLPGKPDGILEALNLYLENKLYKEAVTLLDSHSDDSELHYRLFYMILSTFIEEGPLGEYSQRLSLMLPTRFRLAEFCNLIKGFEDASQSIDVFSSGDRTASCEDMQPLLCKLVERGNGSMLETK